MTQYDSLFPVVAGVAAGAMIGILLGIVLTARNTAAADAARLAPNYFATFVNRPLRDIPLFELMVHAAIVGNSCLVVFALAALPVFAARWRGTPLDWSVIGAYAVAAAFCLLGYRTGKTIWLARS